jgi:hypothetical protein
VRLLLEKLKPEDGDAIIIGSDTKDERTAELAAKTAALTIIAHERQRKSATLTVCLPKAKYYYTLNLMKSNVKQTALQKRVWRYV